MRDPHGVVCHKSVLKLRDFHLWKLIWSDYGMEVVV